MILRTQLGHAIEVESSHSGQHVMIDLGGDFNFKALTKRDARELARVLLATLGVKGTPCADGCTSYVIDGDDDAASA